MANLSISMKCNSNCAYCFARTEMGTPRATGPFMPMDLFNRCLDLLDRSKIGQVRLLGGEPTLHPDFTSIVDESLRRGKHLFIFSNGRMPEKALRRIEEITPENVTVMINAAPPAGAMMQVFEEQTGALSRLRQRVLLGLNIHSPAVHLDFLLNWIRRYDLSPNIRLGLAHPSSGSGNRYLHPRYYPGVGRRIAAFALPAGKAGVQITLDCGFVPCMFPAECLSRLNFGDSETGRRCSPIIDVLPDGQVISCYPLAHLHRESLPEEHDLTWLRARFEGAFKPYRAVMLYRTCATCAFRENGQCIGGCLAASMMRARPAESTSSSAGSHDQ